MLGSGYTIVNTTLKVLVLEKHTHIHMHTCTHVCSYTKSDKCKEMNRA